MSIVAQLCFWWGVLLWNCQCSSHWMLDSLFLLEIVWLRFWGKVWLYSWKLIKFEGVRCLSILKFPDIAFGGKCCWVMENSWDSKWLFAILSVCFFFELEIVFVCRLISYLFNESSWRCKMCVRFSLMHPPLFVMTLKFSFRMVFGAFSVTFEFRCFAS